MNIVIVGAGSIGSYLAATFSRREHNVILIDQNWTALEAIAQQSDIAVRLGNGTDFELLEELRDQSPDVFFALTQNDETNLVACAIAKELGYRITVARVRKEHYLQATRIDCSKILGADYLIAPELAAAHEIVAVLLSEGAIFSRSFAHGAVQMKTVKVPDHWRYDTVSLSQINLPPRLVVGLIRRPEEWKKKKKKENFRTIFPHGRDCIWPGDEVTFIGECESVQLVNDFVGIAAEPLDSAVVIGGSIIGVKVACLLDESGVSVQLIEANQQRCAKLAQELKNISVLYADATDVAFLKSERIGQSDTVIVATGSDQVNFFIGMAAIDLGAKQVIAALQDPSVADLFIKAGFAHTISARGAAATQLLTIANTEAVSSIVSLYTAEAEVLEVKVTQESPLIGIPISELAPHLPDDFLFAVIQNRGRILIANGKRILSPGDSVIVISHPRHIDSLRQMF